MIRRSFIRRMAMVAAAGMLGVELAWRAPAVPKAGWSGACIEASHTMSDELLAQTLAQMENSVREYWRLVDLGHGRIVGITDE